MTFPDVRVAHAPLLPITLSGDRPSLHMNAPHLGEHTDALLAEVGYTRDEILAVGKTPTAKKN